MWFYVLCPVFLPLLCFILALLWHLEMKDLWKIPQNKEQHPCSCCYGNRVIIWERVSHPSIWTGCCLPTHITYYCLCRAADKVMYYRKIIKKNEMTTSEEPQYASDYPLSATHGFMLSVMAVTQGDAARQTLPGERKATASTSGKLKFGRKYSSLW